jgi:hypothetical protein
MFAGLGGCIEESGDYGGSYSRSHRFSSEDGDEQCQLPRGRVADRDPLHIEESRTVHGYETKRWRWMVGACKVIHYNVTFEMAGTSDSSEALAVTFDVELVDPNGRTVVEQSDVAFLSGSKTVIDWSLKPGSAVQPGEWMLRFSGGGEFHYDVEVYLEY